MVVRGRAVPMPFFSTPFLLFSGGTKARVREDLRKLSGVEEDI